MNTRGRYLVFISVVLISIFILTACSKKAEENTQATQERGFTDIEETTEKPPISDVAIFKLESPAFKDGTEMPLKYCMRQLEGAQNISPALKWSGAPAETRSFALVCYDRHQIANKWIHWMIVNIPANVTEIPEGASGNSAISPAEELVNTYNFKGWGGPLPPTSSGVHEYVFELYALNKEKINPPQKMTYDDFINFIKPYAIGKAVLVGTYKR